MSAVYFVQEADRGVAVWRASDDASDVFLCSVELTAYNSDSQIRDRFAELVNAVADHCRRKHVAEAVDPAAWISELPCSDCTLPEAADVLHRARQAASASELGVTGGGYVAGCCKSRIVGVVMSGGSDAPRSAAR
jgi:hypothetical protein